VASATDNSVWGLSLCEIPGQRDSQHEFSRVNNSVTRPNSARIIQIQ
jgi:hypothetical protein